MSVISTTKSQPISDHRQLVESLSRGGKPAAEWRIGTEHEKFLFRKSDLTPVPYEGADGIAALLEALTLAGWRPVLEGDTVIGLTKDGAGISLEPGGQFELSGAPLADLHETAAELNRHLAEVETVGETLGFGALGLGFNPKWPRESIPWMPKGRYRLMRAYMPTRGNLGLDMMTRTSTVQVNLDFANEADMVEKFRLSLALQPVATALFSNSPFTNGQPNGFQSFRAEIWRDTDPDRTGLLPFVFEDGFGFERYVDWALDVPMYFVYRDGRYVNATGQSFRRFLQGRLPALPGELPSLSDWQDHLTTVFPDVRLKTFLEMRGADCGSRRIITALSAFWVGLLYDAPARAAAWDLVKHWTAADRQGLRDAVPREGLKASVAGRPLTALVPELLRISRAGLKARARIDAAALDETQYLDVLFDLADRGETQSDMLLAKFHGPWAGSIDRIYAEHAY